MARKNDHTRGGGAVRKGQGDHSNSHGSKRKLLSAHQNGSALAPGSKDGGRHAGDKKSGKQGSGSQYQKGGSKISCQDIQYVQNLIERCLQQYMAQKDVVFALQHQARIEPGFTTLVWQKLEEQNPEFFAAYYIRLKLKEQVILFNHLLEQQVQMVQKLQNNHMGGGAWGPQQHQQQQQQGGKHMGQPMQGPGYPMHGMPVNARVHQQPHMAGMMAQQPSNNGSPGIFGNMPLTRSLSNELTTPHSNNGTGMCDYGAQQMLGNSTIPTSDAPFQGGTDRPSGSAGLDQAGGEGTPSMPKVFSLSDLTLELGTQLATEGDASLSLLTGNDSSLGLLPSNFSLGEIPKLESPLDLANE
mmetsp:Transcript_3406/g.8463  ORF Transcript_3406/g.8463 Transcript_3406/m.8463 type:complete len:356 (+) Transcript_3406:441-1508(+)